MAFTINIHYTGVNGSARAFMQEMIDSGTVDAVRAQPGNMRYEYYLPVDDPETVMLVDCWESQDALDIHHASPMMDTIAALRDKYGLTMRVERFENAPLGKRKHTDARTENSLSECLDELHTTELGAERIKRNLSLDADDVVEWCKNVISLPETCITRRGKNWYADAEGCIITINAHSRTIITAHRC